MLRQTNRSPGAASVIISGLTRLSAQVMNSAAGSWPLVRRAKSWPCSGNTRSWNCRAACAIRANLVSSIQSPRNRAGQRTGFGRCPSRQAARPPSITRNIQPRHIHSHDHFAACAAADGCCALACNRVPGAHPSTRSRAPARSGTPPSVALNRFIVCRPRRRHSPSRGSRHVGPERIEGMMRQILAIAAAAVGLALLGSRTCGGCAIGRDHTASLEAIQLLASQGVQPDGLIVDGPGMSLLDNGSVDAATSSSEQYSCVLVRPRSAAVRASLRPCLHRGPILRQRKAIQNNTDCTD